MEELRVLAAGGVGASRLPGGSLPAHPPPGAGSPEGPRPSEGLFSRRGLARPITPNERQESLQRYFG